MNNKGFTLMELLATIVIMALLMMIVFPSLSKLMENNDEKKYKSYEDMMVEYARIYEDKTSIIIQLSDLNELSDVKRNCVGYVEVNRATGVYKPFIKCGNKYTTTGFVQNKVN